ncbi:MAG TPA: tetratricopeptide repeat protein [Thermoanaerobaculia bacterium]|jgi:tetratricopeptide (TPR) repeat protein|nr:tetratricopeptide repeat protein [Thermoanaerobaculia bacterium]
MRPNRSLALLWILGVAGGTATFACAKKEAPAPVVETQPTPPDGGKIPVTTASTDAKTEFLQGRDLSEKLLITDSIAHFEKAASLDPNFALAELNLANSSPTGKEFFEHLGKAVSLADKASNGEKLLILATEAGANNNAVKQKEYLEQLVAAYPNDERAHFNLGGYYFGQQDFPQAIEHYKKATELAPSYSPAYNLLGYAYRQNADYANAEKAFQKYIELIPRDPNPYDSYGELLLKEGKFDDSIAQYRKALAIDPNFLASHQGIAADLMYRGKPDEAAAELDNITKKARNDGERRLALFALTVLHVDGGKMAKALGDVDKQYALGEKTKDVPAMAGDLQLKGNILLEMGKAAEAKAAFERALKMIEDSSLSQEIKDNNKRTIHYNLARVALVKKDFAAAKTEAEEFRKGAEASNNPAQVRLAHELTGTIALAERDYDKALAELQQANQQNPQNLYRMCQAYEGKGDKEKAKELCTKAGGFNSLPQLNYAFIRTKAKAAAEKS